MILCDTGPLIALIDEREPAHAACVEAAARLPAEPMLLTWPCLTETMYFAGRFGGTPAQERIWRFLESGAVSMLPHGEQDLNRMHELMRQYADLPMDLADASIVSAAEATGSREVFTLDRHFHAYRIHNKASFTVIP